MYTARLCIAIVITYKDYADAYQNLIYQKTQKIMKTLSAILYSMGLVSLFFASETNANASVTDPISGDTSKIQTIYESDFDATSGSPEGWSDKALIGKEENGNQYLQGVSANESSKAPALAAFSFSPVKGALALEFRYLALEAKNWSSFLSFSQEGFELFRLLTVNFKINVEAIAGAGSSSFARKKPSGQWTNVRLELTTDKEMNNLVAYSDGKLMGIYSVPSLYQQTIDNIAFGRLAKIDDLKVMTGKGAFTVPDNSEKYVFINQAPASERKPSVIIPKETDPLSLFLDRTPPKILKDIDTKTKDGITVRRFTFLARPSNKEHDLLQSEVFTIIAEPAAPGRYPGLIILHGGTGVADEKQAIAWAKEGYVAMTISQPGVTHPSKSIHTKGVTRLPYGFNRFRASPDAATSTMMDAFIAGVKAFQLLETQPKVDPSKIGMTGISWGGFTTTAIAGLLGERLEAAFAVYGCGFLEHSGVAYQINKMKDDEKEMWLKYIDAGRRAHNIKAPYFIVAPTNDSHFWPISIEKTLQAIPAHTNQLLVPNENHRASVPGGTLKKNIPGYVAMETQYFAHYLKGEGEPFPQITAQSNSADPMHVKFTLKGSATFINPQLFYTVDANPDWRKRKWKEVDTKKTGEDTYSAILTETGPEGIYWFAMASDERDLTVSSRLQHISPSK